MPTLLIRFPGRRYHATPWGHHVNEGLVEWPPSPWRLLRALLSTGYTSGIWGPEGPDETGISLIEKLAGLLPQYHLPPASGAHTRHYMPLGKLDNGREKTTMVFDTWADVADGVLAVVWDVALTADETALFENLASRLGYLGRSESWVEACLALPDMPLPPVNCTCSDKPPLPGWEQVSLLAAMSAADYDIWRETAVVQATSALPQPKPGKKPTAKMQENFNKSIAPFPVDLVSCLQLSTNELRGYGWSQPPGSRRVFYHRKTASLEVGPPRIHRRSKPQPVEAMLLSLATATGNNHALPLVARTLPQAERLHAQLVGRLNGSNNPAVTGCDEKGAPLREPHRHAHLLPLDLDGDGRLEHLLVWAPMGLDGQAQDAVRSVRKTFAKGVDALRVALAASGALDDMRTLPGLYGNGLMAVLGTCEGCCEWISRTPFVPPRFLKKQGKNSLHGQVIAELSSRNLPEPVEIKLLDPRENDSARKQRHFIRSRRNGLEAPIDCGFSLYMRFSAPQRGPICLGYGCHFGLGLFVPASN